MNGVNAFAMSIGNKNWLKIVNIKFEWFVLLEINLRFNEGCKKKMFILSGL
jgi:hypothetical protein